MEFLYLYLFLINAAGFLLMLIDKRRAIKSRWRIPEKTLLLFALLGGSFGVLLGMKLARHKTKKPVFSIGVPIILAVWIISLFFLIFFKRIV